MPNWCEGSLKLRGNSENILRFFKEGLTSYVAHWNENNEYENIPVDKDKWLKIVDDGDDYEVYLTPVATAWIHIDNTKRAFTDGQHSIVLKKSSPNAVVAIDIKQAWDFCADEWLDIANKYQIDIRLHGIESGMGFMRMVDIGYNGGLKREIITDSCEEFDDYNEFTWNCPFPWMGG